MGLQTLPNLSRPQDQGRPSLFTAPLVSSRPAQPIVHSVATVISQVTVYISESEKLFSHRGKDPFVLCGTFHIKFCWTKMLAKGNPAFFLCFKLRVSLCGRIKVSLLLIYAVIVFNLASECHCLKRDLLNWFYLKEERFAAKYLYMYILVSTCIYIITGFFYPKECFPFSQESGM